MIIGYTRRVCAVEDCNKKGRNKGNYRGKTRYDMYCEAHHRLRYVEKNGAMTEYFLARTLIPNGKCEQCGWDKAKCDRHRKVHDKGYTRENVIVLCPNCHRIAHGN